MCIGLHTLPPCLLFCGNYILHESEYDVHIFCVALDIIIYPAALTKQGCLQSVAHSRCTTQRHQRLTTRIGATPKAKTLWLLAKSFARCKTNIASNAKHPFLKKYIGFFDGLKIFFLTILQVSEIRK